MFDRQDNPNKQGDIGMGICISFFTSKLATVAIPLTDSQKYDVIVDWNGLKRVSIKTATKQLNSGGFEVDLRTQGGNYTQKSKMYKNSPENYDLLFVACSNGKCFLIPSNIVGDKSTISVGGKSYNEYCVIGVNG